MWRKWTIGKVFLPLMCIVSLLSIRCEALAANRLDDIQEGTKPGTVDNSIITANTRFGFNLFNEIRKTEQNKNIFISPFSVSVALAMTLNGAFGETEQAMTDTLKLQGLDSESIKTDYARLSQTLLTSDPKVTLTIANALWARQGVPFKQEFLQCNAQSFGAKISTLDFNDLRAPNTINQWVNTNTNGKIPKIVGNKIDPTTVLFLTNAIYFKGTWQRKFNSFLTQERTFHLSDGTKKQVPMMKQVHRYPHYRGKNFQAIRLAYGDGRMSMSIFLPDPESNLTIFLEQLNTESWQDWMSQFHEQKMSVVIPKFKLAYEKPLSDPLKALGMDVAFDPELADFSRIAPLEILGANLYIGQVIHKTFVEVNEEGTEAAAVTAKAGFPLARMPAPFIVDRPFFFAILDNKTKTVLFMGVVVDP